MNQLNPRLASLYRLFLRATSASVLHSGPATKSLRKLFRPTFEAAAKTVKNLENSTHNNPTHLRNWLHEFDNRINGTLSLLHNSSHTRGLPHRVVNHLSILAHSNYQWSKARYLTPSGSWNPRLPPNSPQYKIIPKDLREGKREYNKLMRQRRLDRIDDHAWGALGEAILMAEGRDGLVLGRTRFNERRARL